MGISRILFRVAAVVMAATLIAASARADDITPSHLEAALTAVRAAKASKQYDAVLPALSERVVNELIRLRPDLYRQISDAVRQEALKLVSRRADLDNDIARIWANAFTEDELKSITAFYNSPAGKKLVDVGQHVVADSLQSLRDWSDSVERLLLKNSRQELQKQGVTF